MSPDAKPCWSPSMRVVWFFSNVFFGLLSVGALSFAAMALTEDGQVDYRAIGAGLFGLGAIAWCASTAKHPEEWITADGKAKRSFRVQK